MKVIITGATGMVGEGVLLTCLEDSNIEKIVVVSRKPTGYTHEKLDELLHDDFLDWSSCKQEIKNFDACFFCLGVSSVGMDKSLYERLTYYLTLAFANWIYPSNPKLTFCYVSGTGTDSSEKGRIHWARVKGKTENELNKIGFKQTFHFRPGFILPIKGQKYSHNYYKYISWIFPIGRLLYPSGFCKLTELGRAMIKVTTSGYHKNTIEGRDIIRLGEP